MRTADVAAADASPVRARRGFRFLPGLNPLAKIGAPLPAIVYLVFVRDTATPLAFLALALVVLFVGSALRARVLGTVLLGVTAAVTVLTLSFTLWTDPGRVVGTAPLVSVGEWTLYSGAFQVGLATGLRLTAIAALSLPAGLTTTGPDLARAMVQQLRVPYRVGYAVIAAFRFVPRFAQDLDGIRAAHRVRGMAGGRGPFAGIARRFGYIVPLLAGAIRHAERVALSMDSRAFGAYPSRTERHLLRFGRPEWTFMVLFWVLSAVLIVVAGLA